MSEAEGKTPCYRRDDKGEFLPAPAGDGYRLPAEAEWEYACRAGTTTHYSFGDDSAKFDDFGWSVKMAPVPQPHPVAAKKPNHFGLFDMHGNSDEWCQDWIDVHYYSKSPAADPVGPSLGESRVRRGGGFDAPMVRCRSAFRGNYPPYWRFESLGFRVARVSTTVANQSQGLARLDTNSKRTEPAGRPAPLKNDARVVASAAFTLKKHVGAVTRVAFHPTLPYLASAGKDGRVLLWRTDDQSLKSELGKYVVEVWGLKFSPDGELLAFGSRDWWKAEVVFKSVESGRQVSTLGNFKYGGGAVASIAFSPDGLLFAAGQDDGTIRLWNTASFQEIAPLSVGSNVLALAFGPIAVDRKHKRTDYLLAAGCQDGSLKTLLVSFAKNREDSIVFEPTGTSFPQQGAVLGLRFSPDGQWLAATRSGGLIALHDPKTGGTVREIRGNSGDTSWVTFHPQCPWFMTAHKNERVARIWDSATGERLCELRGHTGGVLCAEFSRDGRRAATASEDFSIRIWDIASPELAGTPRRPKKAKAAAPTVGD